MLSQAAALYYIAALLVATSCAALFLRDRKTRDAVISRIISQRRRATASITPPRSLSPVKPTATSSSSAAPGDHKEAYPPSRRSVLADLRSTTAGPTHGTADEIPLASSSQLPDRKTADPATHAEHHTATGFKLRDILELGDFPDYAALSGVSPPAAYTEFDINKAKPRPYRPLRWAYHQTMSLTKMENDWWLELESTYVERIKQRIALFKEHGSKVLQSLPGCEIAAKELMEMCLQFLSTRYPHYFRIDKTAMIFHNIPLSTQTDLRATPPLEVLLHNVPEDFAIMLRDPETGLYTFRGGMICSSLGWTLGSKIGLPLHAIHAPIPDYRAKMQFSMDRYFARMPTDKPIQRGSWGLEIGTPLYMPAGDPHEALRDTQSADHKIEDCNLRVDWQTLRRLPLSGAIVFNFKALFTPVAEFRDEAYIPSLLLKVLREGKREIMEYKNTWHTEHLVIPALEAYEKEQIEKGLIEKDWEPQTLDASPFYPNWETKWHARQGF